MLLLFLKADKLYLSLFWLGATIVYTVFLWFIGISIKQTKQRLILFEAFFYGILLCNKKEPSKNVQGTLKAPDLPDSALLTLRAHGLDTRLSLLGSCRWAIPYLKRTRKVKATNKPQGVSIKLATSATCTGRALLFTHIYIIMDFS